MNFNLVNLVKDYLNDSLVNKISRAIDTDITLTESALKGAIPSLLASFQDLSAKPYSAATAFNTISNQNGGILKSFDEILTTGNHVQLANAGNNILTTALGSTLTNDLAGNISNLSGMDKASASSLLGLITPVTLSLLKLKLLDSGEFNATNLTAILNDQQDNIQSAMPSALSPFYALDSEKTDGNISKDINNTGNTNSASTTDIYSQHHSRNNTTISSNNSKQPTEQTQNEYSANSSFWLTKVLPLCLFTGVLYLAFNVMFNRDDAPTHKEPVTNASSTSLSHIQKPLSRNRSSSYQTNINQHMQPTSQQATTDKAPVKQIPQNHTNNETQPRIRSIEQIEIAQNLQSELQNSLNHVANTLGKIVDISSSRVAVGEIRKVTARINELTTLAKTMSDPVKERLEKLITSSIPRLQALTKNANDIPEVGAVIKPSIQELAASLTNFL